MLGNLIKIFLNHGDFPTACRMMAKVNESKSTTSSFVTIDTLERFLDACVQQGNSPMALMAVDYAADMGFERAGSMAATIKSSLTLDDRQTKTLEAMVAKCPATAT